MVRAEKIVEIDETTNLVALTEDVQSSGGTTVLQHNGKLVAKLVPVKKTRKKPAFEGKPMTYDDPFWKLVGVGSSEDGPTDVSSNIHKYIADAIYEHKFGHRSE